MSSSGNSEAVSSFLFAPRLSISSILHCSVWIHISVWYQFLPAWRTSFEECWPLFWHTVKFLSDPFKVAVKLFPEQPEPRTILVTPPGVLGSLSSVLWGWWECKSFPALCGSSVHVQSSPQLKLWGDTLADIQSSSCLNRPQLWLCISARPLNVAWFCSSCTTVWNKVGWLVGLTSRGISFSQFDVVL